MKNMIEKFLKQEILIIISLLYKLIEYFGSTKIK